MRITITDYKDVKTFIQSTVTGSDFHLPEFDKEVTKMITAHIKKGWEFVEIKYQVVTRASGVRYLLAHIIFTG